MTILFEFFKFVLLLPLFHYFVFMGPVSIFYIAFAAISFFACLLQLFIAFRKRGDFLFLICSLLSVVVFASYGLMVLCTTVLGITCPPLTLLRYQLILNQVVSIFMIGVISQLLNDPRKLYILLNISILGLLVLLSLFIPDNILFGEHSAIRRLILPQGDNLMMIAPGLTLWRVIFDLTILLFVISTFLLLIKRLNFVSFRTIVILFSGIGILVLSAIFDHLVDQGQITSFYLLPFANFILYIILILMPFVIFIKEIIHQENIINQERKWLNLVNQADLIIVGLNRMGHVDFINPFFYKLTGYREDEVLGKDWFEFFIPPKEHFNVQGAFVEILEFEFHSSYLNPILTKNKEEKMIKWFNVRTRNHLGNIIGSLSIGIDLTKETLDSENLLKRLQEAERLISKLKKKSERT